MVERRGSLFFSVCGIIIAAFALIEFLFASLGGFEWTRTTTFGWLIFPASALTIALLGRLAIAKVEQIHGVDKDWKSLAEREEREEA